MLRANKLLNTPPCGFCIINMVSKVFFTIEFFYSQLKYALVCSCKFYSESDYFETYLIYKCLNSLFLVLIDLRIP